MPIIFKGSLNNVPQKAPEPIREIKSNFAEIRKQAEHDVKVAAQQKEDSDLIKPKYIKDKSVFYKSSGYLKDLLGEGN